MPKVFLSHSSKDKAFARKLAEQLIASGVEVWIDEAEIRVGDSLVSKIGEGIQDSDFIAVILSHNSVNSDWVQKELQVAMSRELVDRQVRVLPILKEACTIPPFLADKLYADFTDVQSFGDAFGTLLRAVGISQSTMVKQPPSTVKDATDSMMTITGSKTTERLQGFDDIIIVGVDRQRTYKPDDTKALYNVYLHLSDSPPAEWEDLFDAERQFPRHTMWRRAWIEGAFIIVHCVPDELKKYHLKDLKEDVSQTNVKYRGYLKREVDRELREIKKRTKNEEGLNDALSGLEF